MTKQKTNKSISKRLKVTGSGKLLRRHQLGVGHLKSHKSKSALERHIKSRRVFKSEDKKYRKLLGL